MLLSTVLCTNWNYIAEQWVSMKTKYLIRATIYRARIILLIILDPKYIKECRKRKELYYDNSVCTRSLNIIRRAANTSYETISYFYGNLLEGIIL